MWDVPLCTLVLMYRQASYTLDPKKGFHLSEREKVRTLKKLMESKHG